MREDFFNIAAIFVLGYAFPLFRILPRVKRQRNQVITSFPIFPLNRKRVSINLFNAQLSKLANLKNRNRNTLKYCKIIFSSVFSREIDEAIFRKNERKHIFNI